MGLVEFHNSAGLPDEPLRSLCVEAAAPWAIAPVTLRVRFSRGADFSGTCFYADRRVYVNLGRHVVYPYLIQTNLAKARTAGRCWYRPIYTLEVADACQLAWFIFLHELYHLLIKRARRNTRQKEAMCDRFAARRLVERFGRPVRTRNGRPVPRGLWDFQDLDAFVDAARDHRRTASPAARPEPRRAATPRARDRQLTLF